MNTSSVTRNLVEHQPKLNQHNAESRWVRAFQSAFAKAEPNEVVFLAHPMEFKSSLEFLLLELTKQHLYASSNGRLALYSVLGALMFAVKMVLTPFMLLLPVMPVDRYQVTAKNGKRVIVRTWLLPHVVLEYTWRWMHPIINWKIRRSIYHAASLGIRVVCLGAGNKSGINNAGKMILDAVRHQLPPGMRLMHGDNMTSMAVGHRLLSAVKPGDKIMVLGAGKIVRPHLVTLAKRGHEIKVLTNQIKLVLELRDLVGAESAHLIQHVSSLRDGQDCRIWTNANFVKGRRGMDLIKQLPENVVLLDYCVPNVVTRKEVESKPGLTYVEAGNVLLQKDILCTRMFPLRLSRDGFYSCNAALISAMLTGGLQDHEIGPDLTPEEIEAWGQKMKTAGVFHLAPHAFGQTVSLPQ